MGSPTLDIRLISAQGVKNVRKLQVRSLFKMKVYVVGFIDGDPDSKQQTPADNDGSTNPFWDFQMKFKIHESAIRDDQAHLVLELYCDRRLADPKYVGEVRVPIKELFDRAGERTSDLAVSYPVTQPSQDPEGKLNFWYKFVGVSLPNEIPSPPHKPPSNIRKGLSI
ncbi:PREDICTED: protein SRC2-like [Nelumbo nucifera]|uniref:C2 domain-containing protein n=2 Tax=Nelumbo nucifera TaxID=4432 RepID=A0A822YZU2_NELNU|nr:PREDICTED: protein SRC2-like [Nelumbo nucifera]DAD38030.1 TPA_asm: hypothetical protein HUJ06_008671 [Nelumbo nucifera]